MRFRVYNIHLNLCFEKKNIISFKSTLKNILYIIIRYYILVSYIYYYYYYSTMKYKLHLLIFVRYYASTITNKTSLYYTIEI